MHSHSLTRLSPVYDRMVAAGRTRHLGIDPTGPFSKDQNGNTWKPERQIFDASNKAHKEAYASFLKTGKWGNIAFHAEWPATTVVRTIERKLISYALGEDVYATIHTAKKS